MGMQYYPVIHLQPNGPLFLGGLTFNFMGWIFQNMGLRVSRHWIRIPSWTNRRNGMSPKYFMESIKFFVFFFVAQVSNPIKQGGRGPTFLSRGETHQPPKLSKAWTSFCGRPRNFRPGWVNVGMTTVGPLTDRWPMRSGGFFVVKSWFGWVFLKRHHMGPKWGGGNHLQ